MVITPEITPTDQHTLIDTTLPFLHNMLEQFTTNSLDVTSCSPVFCHDISQGLTCIRKVRKLRFPSCQWRISPSRTRTSSLSRQWTNSVVPSGTQLRCMRLVLYTASLEISVAPPVSEETLSTALHIIVHIFRPSVHSKTLRQPILPSYVEDSKSFFAAS
jgi:hypothetical protein